MLFRSSSSRHRLVVGGDVLRGLGLAVLHGRLHVLAVQRLVEGGDHILADRGEGAGAAAQGCAGGGVGVQLIVEHLDIRIGEFLPALLLLRGLPIGEQVAGDLEQAAEHLAAHALYLIEVDHVREVVYNADMVKELFSTHH